MKTRNVYLTFLCALLCLTLLTACAAPRLSAAQIAAARADYPLRSTQTIETGDSYDMNALKTFQSIKQNNLQNGFCLAEVTLKSVDDYAAEEKVGDGYPAEKLNRVYWIVHIDNILEQKAGTSLDETVVLFLGARETYGEAPDLPEGTKMIVSIAQVPDGVNFPEQEKFYGCPFLFSYYVTADNHILAIYDLPGTTEMDGKPLSAFRSEVKNIFQ